jgi:hypothetical protein
MYRCFEGTCCVHVQSRRAAPEKNEGKEKVQWETVAPKGEGPNIWEDRDE